MQGVSVLLLLTSWYFKCCYAIWRSCIWEWKYFNLPTNICNWNSFYLTASYVLMWSVGRGLWWIHMCNEFKPLPAYTNDRGKLKFSQVFPMRVFNGVLYWMSARWWWFLSKYFPNGGFWVYISWCNPKRDPWALVSHIGLRGVLNATACYML